MATCFVMRVRVFLLALLTGCTATLRRSGIECFGTSGPRRRLDGNGVLRGVEVYAGSQLVESWTAPKSAP